MSKMNEELHKEFVQRMMPHAEAFAKTAREVLNEGLAKQDPITSSEAVLNTMCGIIGSLTQENSVDYTVALGYRMLQIKNDSLRRKDEVEEDAPQQ